MSTSVLTQVAPQETRSVETRLPAFDRLRSPEAPVAPMFRERWSPRAFGDEPVAPETLRSLFEAARWAPSSANEQPWLFVYAAQPDDRARFLEAILPFNRVWAEKAPVLAFLFARKRYSQPGPFQGQTNRAAAFDAGSAWMSLALQAHLEGLSTHAMGGIDAEVAHRVTGVPSEEFTALIAIAIGTRASPSTLPEALVEREKPSPRRPLAEVAVEGRTGNLPALERSP